MSADFSAYGVPEGWGMLYLSAKPLKRAFQRCMGWGAGVGDHIFEKIARHGTCLGSKRPVSWSGLVWLQITRRRHMH